MGIITNIVSHQRAKAFPYMGISAALANQTEILSSETPRVPGTLALVEGRSSGGDTDTCNTQSGLIHAAVFAALC